MQQSEIDRKITGFSERARLERLQSPEMVQKMKAVRHPGGSIKARIVQTLRRADETASPPITAINWYEIELLNAAIEEWSPEHGVYYEDDVRKYTANRETKLYKCIREHDSDISKPPTNTTFWEETTQIKAWVFGYSGDLLETAPWFQTDDIVEVMKYNDDRWPEREWWILETVTRIQAGSGEDVRCSLYWMQVVGGEIEARLASVYR